MEGAIDNANLLKMCHDCGAGNFVPRATYAYDAAGEDVTVTDASTYNAGGARKKIKVKVHDFFGGTAVGEIGTGAGDVDNAVTVDVSDLNLSKPISVSVTVITDDNIIADGGAYGLLPAGDISHWDVQKR